MGSCAIQSKKHRESKKSGSLTTFQDSPTKRQTKLSQVDEKLQQCCLSQEIDPYCSRFQIHESDFKEHSNLKSQGYYMLYFKFKMLTEQIGEINQQGMSSKLSKGLTKIALLKEKIQRDFKTDVYGQSGPKLPILNEEILIYTLKYTKIVIDVLSSLERDPKYEELFPILSFSFKDIKSKFSNILIELEQVRSKSYSKHQKSEVVI